MGRPRGTSNPMHPSRLLKNGSTNNMTLMNLHLPALAPSQMPRALEEDLESQARAAVGLFGFGAGEHGGVSWSKVSVSPSTFELGGMSVSMGNTGASVSSQSLLLMERVCPLGTNAFLWSTMHNGEAIATDPVESPEGSVSGYEDENDMDMQSSGYLYGSKVLQQYLVKGVTLLPATLEEVVELLVRSDGDDMEMVMQHLVGVKASSSGLIYRRRKKRLRRRHFPSMANGLTASIGKSLSSTTLTYDSDSSSSSSYDEDTEVDDSMEDNQNHYGSHRVSLHTAPPPRSSRSTKSRPSSRQSGLSLERSTSAGFMDDYYQSLVAETGNRGNLSIKWVVGDRPSRVFAQRVNYCLLDYECIIVNDWDETDEGYRSPMYVRSLQSCYLPQCQPWLDEFGSARPTDLQPTGFMVREAKNREGFVEVQFVGSILEKAQLPNAARRSKLRALVARIAKLEEIITSRRLSQSLLAHQPLWVRNNERSGCHCCDAKFSLSRRRHHCRMCGEVCCSDCSPKMDVALPDVGVTSVRVCVSCLRKRRQSADFVCGPSTYSSSYGTPSVLMTATPPLSLTPPPPAPVLSSSSSSEYLSSSSYGSLSSNYGGIMGERKASLASNMLQRFKSG